MEQNDDWIEGKRYMTLETMAEIRTISEEHLPLQNFEAAIDRVVAGPEKKNRGLSEEVKRLPDSAAA